MREAFLFGVGALAFLTSGCASLEGVTREQRQLAIASATFGPGIEKPGAIYVWRPDTSAAVVDSEGNRCVLAASGATTFQAEAEAGLKVQGLEKVLGATTVDASDKQKLVEAFTKLSQQDADGAFADIALFHLCILDQNGTFGADGHGAMKPKAQPMLDAFIETVRIARSRSGNPVAGGEAKPGQ
jgi:hypothetical protein